MSVAWILLVIAGLLEVGWAIGLEYTEGFTRLWPSVWTLAAMVGSDQPVFLCVPSHSGARPVLLQPQK